MRLKFIIFVIVCLICFFPIIVYGEVKDPMDPLNGVDSYVDVTSPPDAIMVAPTLTDEATPSSTAITPNNKDKDIKEKQKEAFSNRFIIAVDSSIWVAGVIAWVIGPVILVSGLLTRNYPVIFGPIFRFITFGKGNVEHMSIVSPLLRSVPLIIFGFFCLTGYIKEIFFSILVYFIQITRGY